MIRVEDHCSAAELKKRLHAERSAEVRDRLRLVLWAGQGVLPAEIAARLGYKERWAGRWLACYNDKGLEGLRGRPKPGRPRKLDAAKEEKLREFVDGRAKDPKASCRLHGGEARQFIEEHLGVPMSLAGAYSTLHRLGYELIKPRPRHEKNDPAAMKEWKQVEAPLLSSKPAKNIRKKRSRSGSRTRRASGRKEP